MTTKKIMIILEAGSTPPEWIHLLTMGELTLADAREPIRVDQQALNNIIAAGTRRGNDLVIDYEHQTLSGGEAPAAGWIKEMQARPDGLWARVDWTDKAAAYITNREYRYFSPVLTLDEERRPTALLNAGLTNFPAITHLPPLVAKSREGMEVIALTAHPDTAAQMARSKKYGIKIRPDGNISKPSKWAQVPDEQWGDPVNYDYPMPDKAHCQNALSRWGDTSNSGQYPKAEQAIIEKRIHSQAQALGIKTQEDKSMPIQQMKGILGLTAEAQDNEVIAAMKGAVESVTVMKGILATLKLPVGATPEQIAGAITALKGDQGELATLKTEVAALKDKEATRVAEGLVEEALKEGKLIPAERDLAVSDAKRDAEGFKARMAVRPKLVPLRDNLGVRIPEGGGTDEPGPEASANERLAFKAQKLAAEKNLDLAKAQAQVLKENPELDREWQQSLRVARA